MTTLHVILAVILIVANFVAAGWGLALARRGGASRLYSQVLAFSQVIVVGQGLIGLMMLAGGDSPEDPLHTRVYGPFMVIAIVVAYGFRTKDPAQNTRVFAIAALIVALLGLRAFYTS